MSEPLVFEKNVRAAYTQVRPCRVPGEHSGLASFTVWVSNDAAAAFSAIWQDPPAIPALPAEAIVVKEVYAATDCFPEQVRRWVAMRKEPGLDPTHNDWHWQEVEASGEVVADGVVEGCITCHRGNDTCTGYGDSAGRDYLCTVP